MSDLAERMAKANELVAAIADCGRRFFYQEGKPSGQFVPDARRGILWRDEYTEAVIDLQPGRSAPRFSHGGSLRSFLGHLRSWVLSGDPPPMGSFGHSWAYPEADIERLQDVARELGFLPRECEMDAARALRSEEPVRPEGARFRTGESGGEVTVVMEWTSPENGPCRCVVRGAMPKSTMPEIRAAMARFEALPEAPAPAGPQP